MGPVTQAEQLSAIREELRMTNHFLAEILHEIKSPSKAKAEPTFTLMNPVILRQAGQP